MPFKVFSVNEYLTSADVNTYFAQHVIAVKPTNESVVSSTSFQDDDHLSVTLQPNGVYWLDMMLIANGSTTGDLKLQIFIPSGTLRWITNGLRIGATTSIDSVNRRSMTGGNVTGGDVGMVGSASMVFPRGIARIGATGGLAYLRWAQNTSNATATQILAGSFMRWTRVK